MALNAIRRLLGLGPTPEQAPSAAPSSSIDSFLRPPHLSAGPQRPPRRIVDVEQDFSQRHHPIPRYSPTRCDITRAVILLSHLLQDRTVPHIIAAILDHAGYWHVIAAEASTYPGPETRVTSDIWPEGCVLVETPRLAGDVRKVVIQVSSSDQGWVSQRNTSSYSWWELAVRRPSLTERPPRQDPQACTEGLDTRRVLTHNRLASGQAERRMFTIKLPFTHMSGQDDDTTESASGFPPAIKYASVEDELFAPLLKYADVRGGLFHRYCTDGRRYSLNAPEAPSELEVQDVPETMCDVNGVVELVQGLRKGERLALVARAMYPGWENVVDGAGIWVYTAGF